MAQCIRSSVLSVRDLSITSKVLGIVGTSGQRGCLRSVSHPLERFRLCRINLQLAKNQHRRQIGGYCRNWGNYTFSIIHRSRNLWKNILRCQKKLRFQFFKLLQCKTQNNSHHCLIINHHSNDCHIKILTVNPELDE